MSYAGLGQISTIPSAIVGRSASRHEAGGAVRVPAAWAQRAANAGNRYNHSTAALIAVDGRAGPATMAALRALSRQFSSDQPVTNDPPTSRVTDNVIIPVALETALAARNLVADPPASSATRRTVRTTTTSGGESSATVPIPGAPPAASPADEVILDEGSSTGVRGLVARYGIWPWVAGGTALVGLGLWFLMGGGLRANRKKRVRRNSIDETCRWHTRQDDESWPEYDGQGIFLTRVCDKCRASKLSRYRPEILSGYGQEDVDEPIDPEPNRKKLVRRNSGDQYRPVPGKRTKDPNNRIVTVVGYGKDAGGEYVTVKLDGSYGAHIRLPVSTIRPLTDEDRRQDGEAADAEWAMAQGVRTPHRRGRR